MDSKTTGNETLPKEAGRPTKYLKKYDEQARKLCLLGYTDTELATFFEIATSTLYLWKIEHPSFSEALIKGKDIADAEVAASMYENAKGFVCEEIDVKVIEGKIVKTKVRKQYPPNVAAGIVWLKNRRKADWKDKQPEDEAAPAIQYNVSVTKEEAAAIIKTYQENI